MGAKNKKRWIWIVCGAAFAALLVAGRSKGESDAAETARPERGRITETVSTYGRIRAVNQVNISPDVSGEVTAIYFEEGDTVRRGDLLLKIKQESYLLAVSQREAALESAVRSLETQRLEAAFRESEHARIAALAEQGAATAAQLRQAEYEAGSARSRCNELECQVAASEAALEASRSELEKTLVYSPMPGILTSLNVETGERVVGTATMAGTEMLSIADLSRMELVVEVGENDINSIKLGDRALIRPDAAPGDTLTGSVSKIAVCASGGGHLGGTTDFKVRISIDSQGKAPLLPGMSASAKIITGSKNDILTLPLQAVAVKDGREIVWKVDGAGRVHSCNVECGIQDFGRVEILSGLSEGDLVVSGPFQAVNKTLKEGDKIKL